MHIYRKFDPLNNESMKLVDEIDLWRANSMLETTDNEKGYVMIKSGLSVTGNNVKNSDLCWDMPERVGEPLTLSLCNADPNPNLTR
jgi:hypothetical protein